MSLTKLQPVSGQCTVKKVSDFPVPSRDVTNQTLRCRLGRVRLVTSPLGTGKSLTFSYSVLSNKSKDADACVIFKLGPQIKEAISNGCTNDLPSPCSIPSPLPFVLNIHKLAAQWNDVCEHWCVNCVCVAPISQVYNGRMEAIQWNGVYVHYVHKQYIHIK